jgi:hypothetical protein
MMQRRRHATVGGFVSGRISLALAATTIWERAGMFQIAAISPDSRACFSPDLKANHARRLVQLD